MRAFSKTSLMTMAGVVGLIVFAAATPAGASVLQDDVAVELTILQAVILGLVEGLTEYLPVSSTGHLLVTNELLGLNSTAESEAAIETYAICIQVGAIIAVLFLYWERIRQMLDGLLGRSEEGRKILTAVFIAFGFTAVIGLAAEETVKERLFGVGPIAAAWIVGGLVILGLSRTGWFDKVGRELGTLTWQNAVVIGVMQALAMWPGVSRSMITIIASVLVGLSLRAAVEFSFLLGLLTLSAATAYEGLQGGEELIDTFGIGTPLVGLVVAFISAMAAVKWMVAWLNEKGFEIFGWYRVGVGILALILLATGAIS
ncbi:MAG: undecaprenyl-diphosphate phosphatase [Acidimicrobiia bacterium]|nr:undecaprenyl-diphosphate phosphatase [Acidimicrobiia bacterium]